jgi:hypothetical protein
LMANDQANSARQISKGVGLRTCPSSCMITSPARELGTTSGEMVILMTRKVGVFTTIPLPSPHSISGWLLDKRQEIPRHIHAAHSVMCSNTMQPLRCNEVGTGLQAPRVPAPNRFSPSATSTVMLPEFGITKPSVGELGKKLEPPVARVPPGPFGTPLSRSCVYATLTFNV